MSQSGGGDLSLRKWLSERDAGWKRLRCNGPERGAALEEGDGFGVFVGGGAAVGQAHPLGLRFFGHQLQVVVEYRVVAAQPDDQEQLVRVDGLAVRAEAAKG